MNEWMNIIQKLQSIFKKLWNDMTFPGLREITLLQLGFLIYPCCVILREPCFFKDKTPILKLALCYF